VADLERTLREALRAHQERVQGLLADVLPDGWTFGQASSRIGAKAGPRLRLRSKTELGDVLFDLRTGSLPTGWVALEDVIAFLIQDLGVKPKSETWPQLLVASRQVAAETFSRIV
jgi:hypothetical protein